MLPLGGVCFRLSQAACVRSRFPCDPCQVAPDKKVLEELLDRRRDRILCRNGLRATACHNPDVYTLCDEDFASQEVFTFWWSLESGKDAKMLPDCAVRTLRSLAAIGQIQVTLIAFQEFENVPDGVIIVSGTVFLAEDKVTKYLAAAHVAVVADYVRMLACTASKKRFAWFWDLDCICLFKLIGEKPEALGLGPESNGFVFATMDSSPGRMGGLEADEIRWAKNGLTQPRDRRYIASAFRFLVGSGLLTELTNALGTTLDAATSQNPLEYNVFMNLVSHDVMRCGLEDAILPVMHASGIPPWRGLKSIQRKHEGDFEWRKVLRQSMCANFYAQSGKDGKRTATWRGSDARVEVGSAWHNIMVEVDRRIAQLTDPATGQALRPSPSFLMSPASADARDYGDRPDLVPWPKWPAADGVQDFPAMAPHREALTALQNRWALLRKIGSGKFGTVYEAMSRSRSSVIRVAVKVEMPRDETDFLNALEAQFLSKSRHPRIVALLDAWVSPSMNVLASRLAL